MVNIKLSELSHTNYQASCNLVAQRCLSCQLSSTVQLYSTVQYSQLSSTSLYKCPAQYSTVARTRPVCISRWLSGVSGASTNKLGNMAPPSLASLSLHATLQVFFLDALECLPLCKRARQLNSETGLSKQCTVAIY